MTFFNTSNILTFQQTTDKTFYSIFLITHTLGKKKAKMKIAKQLVFHVLCEILKLSFSYVSLWEQEWEKWDKEFHTLEAGSSGFDKALAQRRETWISWMTGVCKQRTRLSLKRIFVFARSEELNEISSPWHARETHSTRQKIFRQHEIASFKLFSPLAVEPFDSFQLKFRCLHE